MKVSKSKTILLLTLFVLLITWASSKTIGLDFFSREYLLNGTTDEEPALTPTPTPEPPKSFGGDYSNIEGVLTFRGNSLRTAPAFGVAELHEKKLERLWRFKTPGGGMWGGGAGWTGQPALVRWPKDVKAIMNIPQKFVEDDDFVEVIQASLNGSIYFLDIRTGEQTREPISTGNPIKGSVSIDPRGYPLMYVGQGIKESGEIGFRIYSLIDQKELYFQNGVDSGSPREWPAFDSSALFEKNYDTLYVGGENGYFYKLTLNTHFSLEDKKISIFPSTERFSYKRPDSSASAKDSGYGIENSPAAFENLIYYADNGGLVKCIDVNLNEIWTVENLDDTDASLTLDIENGVPFVYTGCEVDKQGEYGTARILKLHGLTGQIMWEKAYKCHSKFGSSPSNGGVLGTNIVGKKNLHDLVVFTLCRYKEKNSGYIVALDKKTGEERWSIQMSTYAWSSPVDVYDQDGNGYIIQCDRSGVVHIIEGATGKVLSKLAIDTYVEASPAVFNNYMVLTSRNGWIYGLELK